MAIVPISNQSERNSDNEWPIASLASPDRDGSRVLIVMAHPAASSLTRSVTELIDHKSQACGYITEIADLAAEGFSPVFGPADHAAFASDGAVPEDVRKEQQRIDRADHLVLVFPVYWWAMPALLKGWIDRVFVSGWAFAEEPDGQIAKKLGRLKVSLVALAGASAATYARRGYREAMQTQIESGIFDFCGAPVLSSHVVTPEQVTKPTDLQDIADAVVAQMTARWPSRAL